MNAEANDLVAVLTHYGLENLPVTPLNVGLINRTFLVADGGGRYVLQKINPMFAPCIVEDIDAVTRHLESKGLLTPRLIRTVDGNLYAQTDEGCWRVYNFIRGKTREKIESPAVAGEAGMVLARFHKALLDLDYEFKHVRHGVHDTTRHMTGLRAALETGTTHPRYRQILPLAGAILDRHANLPELMKTPPRKVHGDPKISNILFDEKDHRGLCLVDFDTLSNMALPLELGDAFRSWCNPGGEDLEQTGFSLELFRAGLQGYAKEGGDFLLDGEWQSILPATYTIYIELAARFCADALNESFFGWNSEKFKSRSEHNEIRARGQYNAAMALQSVYSDAEKLIGEVFGR